VCVPHTQLFLSIYKHSLCAAGLHLYTIALTLPIQQPMKKEQDNYSINGYELHTQADAVRHFIQKMDINMLQLVLEDKLYHGLTKKVFLEKLELAFAIFKLTNNEELEAWNISCCVESCILECRRGYLFVGNQTPYALPLIIITKNGIVQNILECNNLKMDNVDKETALYHSIHLDDFDLKTGEDITDFPF